MQGWRGMSFLEKKKNLAPTGDEDGRMIPDVGPQCGLFGSKQVV